VATKSSFFWSLKKQIEISQFQHYHAFQ